MRECKYCGHVAIISEWPTISVPFMTCRVTVCPECQYGQDVIWP